jgi:membrane fusion protein (multidrug efflux system)
MFASCTRESDSRVLSPCTSGTRRGVGRRKCGEQAGVHQSVAAQSQAAADVAAGRAAKINLGYTDVVSPISGRVGAALVTQGAYVQASAATMLATIQQIDPIKIDLTQTSVEGLQLRSQVASGRLKLNGPDQARVRLMLEDGSEYPLSGTLQFTDITVDSIKGETDRFAYRFVTR